MHRLYALLLPVFFSFLSISVQAQLSGSSLLEYQYGRVPLLEDDNFSSLYNSIDLGYFHDHLTVNAKIEQYVSPEKDRTYRNISQYNIKYKDKGIEIQLGNFYDIIGNGILLRSYEIKGAVLEDPSYRVRHGFYRDMEGALVKYSSDKFMIKGLKGFPLVNQFPPTVEREFRRVDNVEAIEASYNIKKQTIGTSFLRNEFDGKFNRYISVYANGNLPFDFSYRTEFAQSLSGNNSFPEYDSDSQYAFYFSLSHQFKSLGTVIEYKDYQNFFLGAGFSDPPALVKEQSYSLLNRSTHVPQLIDEKGFQFETYYFTRNNQLITLNIAQLTNELSSTLKYKFQEYFIEFYTPFHSGNSVKAYFDYAKDPFKGEENRYTTGFILEYVFADYWSANLEIGLQQFEREIIDNAEIWNYLTSLTISKTPHFSFNLLWEFSTDNTVTDHRGKDYTGVLKSFPGINFSYKHSYRHTFQIFAGSRRGGPACNAGICYEVLDFSGIELRITSKF